MYGRGQARRVNRLRNYSAENSTKLSTVKSSRILHTTILRRRSLFRSTLGSRSSPFTYGVYGAEKPANTQEGKKNCIFVIENIPDSLVLLALGRKGIRHSKLE